MEQKLKVTNALSDPTRFNIYQHIIEKTEAVTVNDIAEAFDIHPNVARMHLSKLEDVDLIISYTKKTGKGGRPSRLYELSNHVIELNFPHRDYKLLSTIALETLAKLGSSGKQALFDTGFTYGQRMMTHYQDAAELSLEQKLKMLRDASKLLGMYADFHYSEAEQTITYTINNCPFKEVATENDAICLMHEYFLRGMFESLFEDITLSETNNMLEGCKNCTYIAKLSVV